MYILNLLAPKIIKWPNEREKNNIKKHFKKSGKFEGVIGAIDGTYISIKAARKDPQVYINRKCFHAFTMQAITSYDLKFINIFCGYPSSVSDIRIFRNSEIYRNRNENPSILLSHGEYIIGDKAYPNSRFCVPTFMERGNFGIIYTLVVERSFIVLFARFRRSNYLNMSRMDLIPATIIG